MLKTIVVIIESIVLLGVILVNFSLTDSLSQSNHKISTLESSIESTKKDYENKLASQTIKYNEAMIKIADLQKKLDGTLPFKGAGNKTLKMINNYNAHDSSWEEVESFLLKDKTNEIEYNDDKFICGDYALAVHNNAEKQGIRTGIAAIRFINNNVGHALNVFYLGYPKMPLYIDCQYDDYIVYIKENESLWYIPIRTKYEPISDFFKYKENYLFSHLYGLMNKVHEQNGTVSNITIYW